jgi:predicted DsbA family dithiol-disulfide isomerase
MTAPEKMLIEVWSDIACPFCYIGKRRLSAALDAFAHRDDIEVVWRSFQLQPGLVTNPSISIAEYLATSKRLHPDQVARMNQRVRQMGAADGIAFDFEKVVVANTFNAHRLLQFAQAQGLGHAMKERLLLANFSEGANVDDTATLQGLGEQAGLSAEAVRELLAGDGYADEVRRDVAEARELQISGVPFFLLDRAYAISGAQEGALFSQAIERAHGEWRASMTESATPFAGS